MLNIYPFTGKSHCDVLLNNMCETFNSQLVDGRDKPIILALEYISQYPLKRIVNVNKVTDKCDGPLTPTTTKVLNSVKTENTQLYQTEVKSMRLVDHGEISV